MPPPPRSRSGVIGAAPAKRRAPRAGGIAGSLTVEGYGRGGLGLRGRAAGGGSIALGKIGTIGDGGGGGVARGPRQLAPPPGALAMTSADEFDTEAYAHITNHPFRSVADTPLSTFSIDVDTASYANVRRLLRD